MDILVCLCYWQSSSSYIILPSVPSAGKFKQFSTPFDALLGEVGATEYFSISM